MDAIVTWFANTLGQYVSPQITVFIISMLPLIELRGGLLAASLLKVPIMEAIPLCIIGNLIPIPLILLFIKKIFAWMNKFKVFRPIVGWMERRAASKSDKVTRYEFFGLTLFVGIPIPGTGAWMGSLIAALLEMDIKKALAAELLGIAMATIIMSLVSYGLLGAILN